MRPLPLLALATTLLIAAAPARAGILLNQGDVYRVSFDTLTFKSPNASNYNQLGFFASVGNSDPLAVGDRVDVSLFADASAATPFRTINYDTPTSSGFGVTVLSDTYWQDLKGSLSFTMVSGSLALDQVIFHVIRGGDYYEGIVVLQAVPEPSTAVLAAIGLAGLLAWRGRRGARHRGRQAT